MANTFSGGGGGCQCSHVPSIHMSDDDTTALIAAIASELRELQAEQRDRHADLLQAVEKLEARSEVR